MDECTDGSHNCSVNAWCYNVIGSFNCTCILGFGGDGVNCTAGRLGAGGYWSLKSNLIFRALCLRACSVSGTNVCRL